MKNLLFDCEKRVVQIGYSGGMTAANMKVRRKT
jgi:hypothetical protein